MSASVPAWADALTAVLVLVGALTALVASIGLVRLPVFFQRMHAPGLAITLGTWSIVLATVVQVSFAGGELFAHALLVPILLTLTAPVTTIFLVRAAVFRSRLEDAAARRRSETGE